jgi:hypothetical protein
MSDDAPRGDMFAAAQMLAADNARLCGIVIAADKLATAAAAHAVFGTSYTLKGLEDAIKAFEIQRQGQ